MASSSTQSFPYPESAVEAVAYALLKAEGVYPPDEEPGHEEAMQEAARLARAAIDAYTEAMGLRVQRSYGKKYRLVSKWMPTDAT